MATYGTREYYEEQLKKATLKKKSNLISLVCIVEQRQDDKNVEMIDFIVEELHSANYDIRTSTEELKKLDEAEEGKSEE